MNIEVQFSLKLKSGHQQVKGSPAVSPSLFSWMIAHLVAYLLRKLQT